MDYARSQPYILFLDEFDAISKKRDDPSDLGELKRIVNVLLKELEDWPAHSVLIAATNHPEILDKAVWRRFDSVIRIGKPGIDEREKILRRYMEDVFSNDKIYNLLSEISEDATPAELEKLSDRIKRKIILKQEDPVKVTIKEIVNMFGNGKKEFNVRLSKLAKDNLNLSLRELGDLLGKSHSTIHNYLKE